MKICVAQTRPIKGDITRNIVAHSAMVRTAAANGAEIIVFAELSITGYEPTLAADLAMKVNDSRIDEFQQLSDANIMTICIGVPVKAENGVQIGMVIFSPSQPRRLYAKQHLHADEFPFFVPGGEKIFISPGVAPAICYELSIPSHSAEAANGEATVYIASVAKTADGVQRANDHLSGIARKYAMTVLMCNCVGPSDNFISAGHSAVWDKNGNLVAALDDVNEGLLIFDTESGKAALVL